MVSSGSSSRGAPTSGRPNVVMVVADDMGYGDVGAFNASSRIPTPHMDSLAAQGVAFTDAHAASSVCTPSRYALLTGSYCWRGALQHGVLGGYEPPLIGPDDATIASMLQAAGYRTVAVGKWHLGLGYTGVPGSQLDFSRPLPWPVASREFEEQVDFEAPLRGGPIELGFDRFFGTSGCPTCQPPYGWIEGDHFIDPPSIYETEFPYTGRPGMRSATWEHRDADPRIIDRAVQEIAEACGDRPWFLYIGLDAPHEPCVDEVIPQLARGQSEAGPRGDLVWLVDHAVGRIVEALEQTGQRDDTIVIVTSDNGALPGDRVIDRDGVEVYRTYDHDPSGGWRGFKAHIWEGGHREPLIIHWPGVIDGGLSCPGLTCLADLPRTLASLCGAEVPRGAALDSFDLSAMLLDPHRPSPRRSVIHHSQKGVFAVREGSWKAVFGSEGSGGWPPPAGGPPVAGARGQLYRLDVDPVEAHNLWDQRPDVVARLEALLESARREGRTAPA